MERWGLPNLPHEIVYDILSRLPVKPLCRCKSVSKPWLALITDTHFIKSHLHQSMKSNTNQKLIIPPQCSHTFESFYALDYQAPDHTVAELKMLCKNSCIVEIRGSFNGVLLLDLDDGLCLWNPSVRMYQKFSRPKGTCGFRTYALGYDSINDDFKVVAAVCLIKHALTNVDVFSSKLSSWKSIGDFGYSRYLHGPGSVLNGAPHWFLCGNTDMYSNIVCFDVMEEKLKEVPKPICEVKDDFFSLGVLGGWLCVVDNRLESHSDVWVMKEYGVKESWTKLFVVPNVPLNVAGEFFFHYFDLLCFTKDGEVVMRLKLETEELVKFVIYNPKKRTYKRIGMPQDWKRFDVTVYVESLVSPHGCNSTRRHC